jgi:hypothetical protein
MLTVLVRLATIALLAAGLAQAQNFLGSPVLYEKGEKSRAGTLPHVLPVIVSHGLVFLSPVFVL